MRYPTRTIRGAASFRSSTHLPANSPPVTHDDPYYELTLQQNSWLYRTEYTPRHAADSLAEEWKPGAEVQMKIADKHHMLVKSPGGLELQLIVVKRVPATPGMDAPDPAPVKK